MSSRFRTIVLSCGSLGVEVANALNADGASQVVGLITAPYSTHSRTLRAKIRHVVRRQGYVGLLALIGRKLTSSLRQQREVEPVGAVAAAPEIKCFRVQSFHTPECISIIESLQPDLAVIAGTYILRSSVFSLPRQGSINLHSGKVPEYRGAAPAFWEMYNGESSVGITIHRVVDSVDAGAVLAQELFPIEQAPLIDPLAYIEQFKREVLLPNGVRMLVETVRALSEGSAKAIPQDNGAARTYSTPDHRAVRELRRRVRERRTLRTSNDASD